MSNLLLCPPKGPLEIPNVPLIAASSTSAETILSLIIPTYKESGNVAQLITQLTQLLDNFIPEKYELILVDDDSPDLTWQVAQALTNKYPQLYVIRRQSERGLASAVIRGWQVARGRILGVIDADLQHPPEILLKLISSMLNGADLAIASRHMEGGGVSEWSIARRLLSRGAQVLGLLICPAVVGRVSDPMSGYFTVRRSAIATRRLSPIGYKILLEVIGRGEIQQIAEVGYVFQERESGDSKVTWKQYVGYIGHLIRLRSQGQMSRNRQKWPMKRFIRYGLVGFSGVIVDMVLLYLLYQRVGLGLTISKIIAAEAAILSNFIWNDIWTFADTLKQQTGWSNRFKRLLKFNTICISGLVLNILLLKMFFSVIFENNLPYLANLITILLVAVWNFWLNLKLSWRVTAIQ